MDCFQCVGMLSGPVEKETGLGRPAELWRRGMLRSRIAGRFDIVEEVGESTFAGGGGGGGGGGTGANVSGATVSGPPVTEAGSSSSLGDASSTDSTLLDL